MSIRERIVKNYHLHFPKYYFLFYKYFNRIRGKKRILLYTDSRGKNIPNHYYYDHYSKRLAKKYSLDTYLCPEKWTTTFDFIKLIEKVNLKDYDLVLLHTGIVEFSPRPQKSFNEVIYPQKKKYFDLIFGEDKMKLHLDFDLGVPYEGDKTNNMYSLQMAEEYLIPYLQKVSNLIWIGGNKIVPDWLGNYWRPRPENLNITEHYNRLFIEKLPNTIDMMDWSLEEVKEYTYDIIHVNQKGSDILYQRLVDKIEWYFKTSS